MSVELIDVIIQNN